MELVRIRRKTGAYLENRSALLDEAYVKASRTQRPLFAHVYVENRCHLACAHCYESEQSHPSKAGLSLEEYDRVFDGLARLGVLVVTFSGGEPFLRKDFLEVVALARRKRFAVRVYTSGTLLDEARADRLKELQVSEVHVSVYSDDPALHDEFTGRPGSHEKSLRALRLLAARGVHTVLKANVLTFNVRHLDRLVALARELRADFQIEPTVKPRVDGDRAPLRWAVSSEELNAQLLRRPDLQKAMGMDEAQAVCRGENFRARGGSLCAAARGIVTVGADGGVYPCAMFPVHGGSVREADVDAIFHGSPLFHRVRAQTFADMKECPTCDVRGGCAPCMAYALIEHGDIGACASDARQMATARKLHAEELVRANRKAARGRPLPILGDDRVPELEPPALATET